MAILTVNKNSNNVVGTNKTFSIADVDMAFPIIPKKYKMGKTQISISAILPMPVNNRLDFISTSNRLKKFIKIETISKKIISSFDLSLPPQTIS